MATSVPFKFATGASTNLTRIPGGSQGAKVKSVVVTNTATYAIFVKLYWGNAIPTVGTTIPVMTITCPAAAASGGGTQVDFSEGVAGNGQLWCWVTKVAVDSDTTVTVANDGLITLCVE